jgi:serine protease Do
MFQSAMFRFVFMWIWLLMVSAQAEPLPELKQQERWLVIASTTDLNTAKGIAGHYVGAGAKIVSSDSGFYAVVFGPFRARSVFAIKKQRIGLSDIPRDSMLSHGKTFKEIVWREDVSRIGQSPLATYSLSKPLQLAADGLNVTVSALPDKDDVTVGGLTLVVGQRNGVEIFRFTLGEDILNEYGSEAGFIKLDPTTEGPQLIVTRYTGGAHCCTEFWAITKPKDSGGYVLVQGATLDGGGYGYRDLDGDGAMELVSADNRFLYAFDSYAASFAPWRVNQLRGTSINDLTEQAISNDLRAEYLAYIDFSAKLNPDIWKSNGFLAAWVAVQIRAGNGEDAWQAMLENHDRNSDAGPMKCLTGQTIDQCPVDNLESIPFPKALAQFLQETGYGPLPISAQSLMQ